MANGGGAGAPASALPTPDPRLPTPATRPTLRVGLVAGEASGDLLGAGLVEALRARFPGAEFAGIGGAAMLLCALALRDDVERRRADRAAGRLFAVSILYLFALFATLLVESTVAGLR